MRATVEQLATVEVFADLEPPHLERLTGASTVSPYPAGAIVVHAGERLPAAFHGLLQGALQVSKIAANGKETILRTLGVGEMFAAPALFGDGIAPATLTALTATEVVRIERQALLQAIEQTPEIALRMLAVLNRRLQELHDTVHGLFSERATVRLARLLLMSERQSGSHSVPEGRQLHTALTYYQIARRIGISYEECVRLCRRLEEVFTYDRGTITLRDPERLAILAAGEADL